MRLNNTGKWTCDRLTKDADFGKKKIIFSAEAYFDLGGYVNKQNCRIWGTENPKRVTVWYGFWSRGIIGPFFFENKLGETVTVNGDRYRAMFVNKNWREGYWQHLVSTGRHYVPHSQNYTRCFRTCFWRSHYQPQSWCRLITSELYYYLWGAVKDKCYADKPETIDDLKNNILEASRRSLVGSVLAY